ncbi:MAG: phosphotransferase family protein [Gammaproteobacteria bacterium]
MTVAAESSLSSSEFRETTQLDWEALGAYLQEQGMRFGGAASVREFAGGYGNWNFLIDVDGAPLVLRRPPAGPLPPGANDMRREYNVLSRLWEAFPLAPKARLLCEDESIIGAAFLLMEYREGLIVRDRLPESLTHCGRELSELLIGTLAALHDVDADQVGLGSMGRPDGFLERTVNGWLKRADVACGGTPPAAVFELGEWLEDNLADEGDCTLLHSDYKLDNMILQAGRPIRVSAVIDWDMCTRGDPLLDLATLLSYWTEAGDPPAMHELAQMPTAAPGFLCREKAAELYAKRTGRDLSDFMFYRVLAMFKLGVVFLQLHARYLRGQITNDRFKGFRKLAEGLLDFALVVSAGKVF